MKYAVYLIVIEDTEESDLSFADLGGVADIIRVRGDLEIDEAYELSGGLAESADG